MTIPTKKPFCWPNAPAATRPLNARKPLTPPRLIPKPHRLGAKPAVVPRASIPAYALPDDATCEHFLIATTTGVSIESVMSARRERAQPAYTVTPVTPVTCAEMLGQSWEEKANAQKAWELEAYLQTMSADERAATEQYIANTRAYLRGERDDLPRLEDYEL